MTTIPTDSWESEADVLRAELKTALRDLAYQIVVKDTLRQALERIAEECHQWQACEFSLRVCDMAERALGPAGDVRAAATEEPASADAVDPPVEDTTDGPRA